MVVHYYKPITIESLNFVLVQLNQTNEDPSIPAFSKRMYVQSELKLQIAKEALAKNL
jgi:hypothetical protein